MPMFKAPDDFCVGLWGLEILFEGRKEIFRNK